MKRPRALKWLTGFMAAAAAMAGSVPAFAQGCAMCYNNAAAARASGIQALRSGVLILLFPVVLLFVGILVVAFRSRNRFNEADAAARAPAHGGENEWAELLRPPEFEPLSAPGEESRVSDGQPSRPAPLCQ